MNSTLLTNVTNSTAQNVPPLTFLGFHLPFTYSPTIDIYIISFLASLFVIIITKYLTDQDKIKMVRKELKEMQKKLKEMMKIDPKKVGSMQKEIMRKNAENLKNSLSIKVMLTTMIPMLLVFGVTQHYYAQFGQFFHIFGFSFGWFGTYFIFSIINSIVLKKLLDVA